MPAVPSARTLATLLLILAVALVVAATNREPFSPWLAFLAGTCALASLALYFIKKR